MATDDQQLVQALPADRSDPALVRELGRTIVMVTHDPVAAGYADRVVFLADGRVAGELAEPTAEGVLEAMQRLERPDRAGPAGV